MVWHLATTPTTPVQPVATRWQVGSGSFAGSLNAPLLAPILTNQWLI